MEKGKVKNYEKWGDDKLIGQSLLNCHNPETMKLYDFEK